jgi:membrane dipeptidase
MADLVDWMGTERRFVWDNVLPHAPIVGNDLQLLDRFALAGHSFVSLTIAGDDCGLAEAVHRLSTVRAGIARRPERFVLVTKLEDVAVAGRHGKLAVGLHLEGTECLERDPDVLDVFYALGIRHSILAFNQNNSAAGGCGDRGNVGLSRLGARYLDRMRDLGMLLDLSHMSERSSFEAIERIERPTVFTHSNARSVFDHYRNVTDAQALACAATGGLIGVSGSSAYIGPATSLAEGAFRHIDHFVQLVGADHVGLGTDYVADADALMKIVAQRPDEWPTDEGATYENMTYLPPEGLLDVIKLLQRANYDETSLRKILGGNYLRIAGEVWR